ncbi:MAG: FkbM family methyltransferase [Pseudomonadota bacterium]
MSLNLIDDVLPPLNLSENIKALLPSWAYLGHKIWRESRRREPELRHLQALVDPGRAALDIGANRGLFTWPLLKHCREVHAFEPNPPMARILHRRFSKAHRKGLFHLHRIALSNRCGEAVLHVPIDSKGAVRHVDASLEEDQGEGASVHKVTVPAERLDDLDLPEVGFIKIDVEGHDLAVIEGGLNLIKRDRPTLLVEFFSGRTRKPLRRIAETEAMTGLGAHVLLDDVIQPLRSSLETLRQRLRKAHRRTTHNVIFR